MRYTVGLRMVVVHFEVEFTISGASNQKGSEKGKLFEKKV